MAAGVGQESTALVSPSWPHALRLLQVGSRIDLESRALIVCAPAVQQLHLVVLVLTVVDT